MHALGVKSSSKADIAQDTGTFRRTYIAVHHKCLRVVLILLAAAQVCGLSSLPETLPQDTDHFGK